MFPRNFDLTIYKNENSDLQHLSDKDLEFHYENLGKLEGRKCSKIKSRTDFIRLVDQQLDILEIGPLCFPSMDVSKNNVKTIDYFTREELLENYKNDNNVDKSKICKVDYAVKSGRYLDVIKERFNIVFSSHNIEHVPCIITFLNNLSDVLKPNSYVFLCIPDYRYCFDRYRNESNIFEILNAYYSKSTIPNIVKVCESNFLTTHNDSVQHWNDQHNSANNIYLDMKKKNDFYQTKKQEIINRFDDIVNLIKDVQNGKYIDSHCWQFTSQSFENIIDILYTKKYIKLKPYRIYHTLNNSCEFYCILKLS